MNDRHPTTPAPAVTLGFRRFGRSAGPGSLVVLAAAVAAATAPGAAASPTDLTLDLAPGAAPALAAADDGPDIELLAGVWLARLGGDATLGAGNASFRIDKRIRNDDLEPTPLVEASILGDDGFLRWRLHGFAFSSDARGSAVGGFDFGSLSFAAGDAFEAETDLASAGVEYALHRLRAVGDRPPSERWPDGDADAGDVTLDFIALLGARWISVDQRIGVPGGAFENPSQDWFAAYAGFRMELGWAPPGGLVIAESFRFTGEYGFGPALNGSGGTMWQVRAGGELEFAPGVTGFFGYRLLELAFEDQDWKFESGLQGLFIGASLQF